MDVIDDVAEDVRVEDARTATDDGFASTDRLIVESEPRPEVILVANLGNIQGECRWITQIETRIAEVVERRAVVLVAQTEINFQVGADFPGVLGIVALRPYFRTCDWIPKRNRRSIPDSDRA